MKRREDGRMVKSITDPRTGKRLYFYGKSEREVNRKILEFTAESTRTRTFNEIVDEWWTEAKSSLAYQSIKSYKPAVERAKAEFGDMMISDIHPKNITLFLRRLSKDGMALRTLANQRSVINMAFNHAVLENYIEVNPCTAVQLPKASKKATRTAASTTDEEIVKATYDVWLFPYIALMTGMRKGEILALQWKDIDFDENLISVTKSVYHEGDRPYIKEPKTKAGCRSVPLLRPLKDVLINIKQDSPETYIISDDGIKPLTNRRFITLMKHYKEETGAECTAHQLRHSFATIAFECGVPIKSVQEILGHKQLSTTMDIYTDFRAKSMTEAADILNAKIT